MLHGEIGWKKMRFVRRRLTDSFVVLQDTEGASKQSKSAPPCERATDLILSIPPPDIHDHESATHATRWTPVGGYGVSMQACLQWWLPFTRVRLKL